MSSTNFDEESPGWTKFIAKVAKEAGEKARQRAFKKGIPVLVMRKDKKLHYEYPEGTFTPYIENSTKK